MPGRLHLALKLSDEARRSAYEAAMTRHGTVHSCGSASALEHTVAAGATVAVLDIEDSDLATRLRQESPALLLILGYDPSGDELSEAVKLAGRRVGVWFADEPGGELDFLLSRASAGRLPSGPTPAELAVDCVAELAPPRAARRFAWLHALSPGSQPDEAAAASRCGEKLRTVQRQFAEIGGTAGAVRRAFQTLHAAYWLRGRAGTTEEIAAVYGGRSARALREAVKDVLGLGVRELRRLAPGDAIGSHLVRRLRADPPHRHRRPDADRRRASRPIRIAPRVSVTLTSGAVVAQVEARKRFVLTDVTGAVLVELMQGRSRRQIVTRMQRNFGLTRGEARIRVDAALGELAARGVLELEPDRLVTQQS